PAAACTRAIVGSGSVHSLIGRPTDPSQRFACDFNVKLINGVKPNELILRLDTVAAIPPQPQCGGLGPDHEAIDASFHKTGWVAAASRGGSASAANLPVWAIKFYMPLQLLHPGGNDLAVIDSVFNIAKTK